MIQLGVIATIIATLFGGTANMLMKKVSQKYEDNYLAIVFQYVAMAIAAISLAFIYASTTHSAFFPQLSVYQRSIILLVGVAGYIGMVALYKAFDHIAGGIALVIANLSVLMTYVLNLVILPGNESLSIGKIAVAIGFFIIIALFLTDGSSSGTTTSQNSSSTDLLANIGATATRNQSHQIYSLRGKVNSRINHTRSHINRYALYPLLTAIGRSIYFVGTAYFVKADRLSPIQTGMLTETAVLIVSLVWFFTLHRTHSFGIIRNHGSKNMRLFLGIGFLNVINVYLTYYGYSSVPANIVNIIKLFCIPVASLMCWIFLKDTLSQKQTLLLMIAVGLMASFIML